MFDLAKMFAGDEGGFVQELQKLGQQGNFNPLALFAGETRFHSVFLAPYSPSLKAQIERFLQDGTGPLRDVAQAFEKQGAAPSEAMNSARTMFTNAKGMCVVVLSDDQGITTVPQLFFGHLADAYCQQVVALCGEGFKDEKSLVSALKELRSKGENGTSWPNLFAGSAAKSALSYWNELGSRLIAGIESGLMANALERLRDCAHWIGAALSGLLEQGARISPDQAAVAVRCHLLAFESEAARERMELAIAEGADEERSLVLIHQFTDAAIQAGKPEVAAAWLAPREAVLGQRLIAYDVALAHFKAQAAAGVSAEQLKSSADRVVKAHRKNARHDLTREPIWRVTVKDPGELIDTSQAAELVGRSPNFIAKRLEQGTIPTFRADDQVRIPKGPLMAWKSIMDAHALLD